MSVQVRDNGGYTEEIYNGPVTVRALNGDATVTSLSLSTGNQNPEFSSAVASYSVPVANTVTSITLSATPAQQKSKLKLRLNAGGWSTLASGTNSDPIALNVGVNTIEVQGTAENGTSTKTYAIVVTRAPSSISTLAALSLSAGSLSPTFTSTTLNYSSSVPNSQASISVTPTVMETRLL